MSKVAIEDFVLAAGEALLDIAFAVRVGTLDGRHRKLEMRAHGSIARALVPNGPFFIDGGNPLKQVTLRT